MNDNIILEGCAQQFFFGSGSQYDLFWVIYGIFGKVENKKLKQK
jgi:hypothetical protein